MSEPVEPSARGFQFPGEFEISAMGAADAELAAKVPDWLRAAGLQVRVDSLRQRPSRAGNYVSVTVAFHAGSRDDYDTAHRVLRAQAEVKWTL